MPNPIAEILSEGTLFNVIINNENKLELYNNFNCLYFNTGNYVNIPSYTIGQDQTFEQWGYSTQFDQSMLFSTDNPAYTGGVDLYFLGTTYNTICWNTGDGQTNAFKNGGINISLPTQNEWHHYSVVCDSVQNKTFLYIDGIYTGEQQYKTIQQTARLFRIGNYNYNTSYQWKGKIVEFRIWNFARSQQEIQQDYNTRLIGNETGLIGYWRMDEGEGTTITDLTSYSNNGTISGQFWFDNLDKNLGNETGIFFNGSSTYVYLYNPQLLQPNNITVEQWFKQPQGSTARLLIRKRTYGYNMVLGSSGALGQGVHQTSSTSISVSTSERMDDNRWHHGQFTYDGTSVRLYVDGNFYGIQTGIIQNQIYYGSGGIAIGRDGDSSGQYFNGIIQEFRIWNTVRTDQEILDNYNVKLTGTESGLIGYWQLLESSGSTAVDLTGNNNGVIYNPNWVNWSLPFAIDLTGYRISPEYTFDDITYSMNSRIQWEQTIPEDTELIIESNLSLDGITWEGWKPCLNDSQIPDITQGLDLTSSKLLIRQTFSTLDPEKTPELSNVKLDISDDTLPIINSVNYPQIVKEASNICIVSNVSGDIYDVKHYINEINIPVIRDNNNYSSIYYQDYIEEPEEILNIRIEQTDLEENVDIETFTINIVKSEQIPIEYKSQYKILNFKEYTREIEYKSQYKLKLEISEILTDIDTQFLLLDVNISEISDYFKRLHEIITMSRT